MAEPLLSLTTLVECPSVQIDGNFHELTPADALDLMSAIKLDTFQRKYYGLAKLLEGGVYSDLDIAEVERAVDELVRIVLRAPAAVIDKLRIVQKMNVVFAFFELSPKRPAMPAATANLASPPTGASSSRNSRGSIQVSRRRSGSRGRRSRSSIGT